MSKSFLSCALLACVIYAPTWSVEEKEPKTPKLRVLYIEGSARWEYRYLKYFMLRDPSAATQCYLTTVQKDFAQESSPGLPSLMALPENPEGYAAYDVVILGALPEEFLEKQGRTLAKNLTDFVKVRGGGLVVLAGPNFRVVPELNELLPVTLPGKLPAEGSGEPFRLRVTEKGEQAAFLRLHKDPAASRRFWEEESEPFRSCFEGAVPKQEAVVLATRSAKEPGGSPQAVIVESKVGEGRTLFLGVDESWRWRAGADNGYNYFYLFWKQALIHVARKRSSSE